MSDEKITYTIDGHFVFDDENMQIILKRVAELEQKIDHINEYYIEEGIGERVENLEQNLGHTKAHLIYRTNDHNLIWIDKYLEEKISELKEHDIFRIWSSIRGGGKTTLDAILKDNTQIRELAKEISELKDSLQKCGVKWDFRLDELGGFITELEQKIESIGRNNDDLIKYKEPEEPNENLIWLDTFNEVVVQKEDLKDDYEVLQELLEYFLKGGTRHLEPDLEQSYKSFLEHKKKYLREDADE